jgi:hypothetical protein
LNYPFVDLLAGERKRRPFHLEDERRRYDSKLGAREDPARLGASEEPLPPFGARIFAQGNEPGRKPITSAYVLRFADSGGHG